MNNIEYIRALQTIKDLSISFNANNNVFTNSTFTNILIPIFSNYDSIYTLAYGDFNGLNKFNNTYGSEAGTQAIIDSIKLIQEHLPDNSSTVRIAGDEFVFLIPNKDSSEIKEMLNEVTPLLENQPDHYLTMSFGLSDSNESNNIYEMYAKAEYQEGISKLESQNEKYSVDALKRKLDTSFSNFFNNYRFSNKLQINSDKLVSLHTIASKVALDLIYSEELRKLYIKNNPMQFSTVIAPNPPVFTFEQASLFFDFINKEEISQEDISSLQSSIYNSQIEKIFNDLTVNPNSGFHNMNYYNRFFIPNVKQCDYNPATLISLDITGVKNCNAQKSHLETDQRLSEIANHISKSFSSILNKDFDSKQGSFDPKNNYIFNQFAGKYLIVLGEQKISEEQLNTLVSDIRSLNIAPMSIIESHIFNSNKKSFEELTAILDKDIQEKKSKQLEKTIISADTQEAFKLFLSDSVDYFMKECPTSSNISTQLKFMKLLTNSITSEAIKSNREYCKTHSAIPKELNLNDDDDR